jgi:putative acetyltransferase
MTSNNAAVLIRQETSADFDSIGRLNRQAFGGEAESQLIDMLREEGVVVASLVAEQNGAIIGNIMFSRLVIETDHGIIEAVSLAPMAVVPEYQRRGIGSELIRRGLEVCRERGERIVVVLGHADYYTRFGFSTDLAKSLNGPFGGGEWWMAIELVPGALTGVEGRVKYPKAFDVISR